MHEKASGSGRMSLNMAAPSTGGEEQCQEKERVPASSRAGVDLAARPSLQEVGWRGATPLRRFQQLVCLHLAMPT